MNIKELELYFFLTEQAEINYYESGAYYENQWEPYTGDTCPLFEHMLDYITDTLLYTLKLPHLLTPFINLMYHEYTN